MPATAGEKKKDSVQPTPSTHSVSAAIEEEESFYTTFGQLFDKEDDISKGCMASIITVDSSENVDESSSLMVMSVNQPNALKQFLTPNSWPNVV